MVDTAPPTDPARLKNLVQLGYLLQAGAVFTGISLIAALILAYLKREEAAGSWLESHIRWQIRTFWFWFGGMAAGLLGLLLIFGWPLIVGINIWFLYRVIKGWLYLSECRPMYPPLVAGPM